MEFKTITNLVGNVIKAVENSAIASTKSLKSHTFKSEVTNLPEIQSVKGEVTVVNQVDKLLEETNKSIKELNKSIETEAKLKREVSVSNPTKEVSVKVVEENTRKTYDILKTVIKNVQSLHAPLESLKAVRVLNHPTKELGQIEKRLVELKESLSKMDLSPVINVAPSVLPSVNVPPAQVTVEQIEIDYNVLAETLASRLFSKDSKEYLSVRLSDGKDFYKAIENLIIEGQSSGKSYAFRDSEGNFTQANLDELGNVKTKEDEYIFHDVDDSEPLYVGEVKPNGNWRIQKLTGDSEMRYSIGESNYQTNWTNRASLSYDYLANL